jgi:hypothetical protein
MLPVVGDRAVPACSFYGSGIGRKSNTCGVLLQKWMAA